MYEIQTVDNLSLSTYLALAFAKEGLLTERVLKEARADVKPGSVPKKFEDAIIAAYSVYGPHPWRDASKELSRTAQHLIAEDLLTQTNGIYSLTKKGSEMLGDASDLVARLSEL